VNHSFGCVGNVHNFSFSKVPSTSSHFGKQFPPTEQTNFTKNLSNRFRNDTFISTFNSTVDTFDGSSDMMVGTFEFSCYMSGCSTDPSTNFFESSFERSKNSLTGLVVAAGGAAGGAVGGVAGLVTGE